MARAMLASSLRAGMSTETGWRLSLRVAIGAEYRRRLQRNRAHGTAANTREMTASAIIWCRAPDGMIHDAVGREIAATRHKHRPLPPVADPGRAVATGRAG